MRCGLDNREGYVFFLDQAGEFHDLGPGERCDNQQCKGACTNRNVLFARYIHEAVSQQQMCDILVAVFDFQLPSGGFTLDALRVCLDSVLELISEQQLLWLKGAMLSFFGDWSRSGLKHIGLSKKQSMKGAQGVLRTLQLA